MSDFIDMFCEMLPTNSEIQKEDNELRKVLDRSIGEYMQNQDDVFNQLFLTSASGGWLDAHGKDFGVVRKQFESDDDFRNRIILASLKHLTPSYLKALYDLDLYVNVNGFSITMNDLTSNNAYISQYGYMVENVNGVMDIIMSKFVLDSNVILIIDEQATQYIYDVNDVNILPNYRNVYNLTDCSNYFKENGGIKSVKLELPNATNCEEFIYECYNLNSVDLSLPNATNCEELLMKCSQLEDMNLNLPSATNCSYLCDQCFSLTEVELSLPSATNCFCLFYACVGLTDIDLDLPNATNLEYLVGDCSNLVNVKVNAPSMDSYNHMFRNCSKLETIELTIPSEKVSDMTSYIQGLNLQYLESLIINGEEVEI